MGEARYESGWYLSKGSTVQPPPADALEPTVPGRVALSRAGSEGARVPGKQQEAQVALIAIFALLGAPAATRLPKPVNDMPALERPLRSGGQVHTRGFLSTG